MAKKRKPQPQRADVRYLAFAREYVVDHNASAAAIRVGYAVSSSRLTGSRLMKTQIVKDYIAKHEAKLAAKMEVTAERVIAEFARIGFSDIREIFDETGALKGIHTLGDDAARSIGAVDIRRERRRGSNADGSPREEEVVKVKLLDKVRALEALAKHTGVLKEPAASAPGSASWQLDPERLAKMSDKEIAQAIEVAKKLTGAA